MTPADIAARHVKHDDGMPGDPRCLDCHDPWPCDASILAAEVERLRGLGERLAEALRMFSTERFLVAAPADGIDAARAALAAWREPGR